MTNIKSFDSGLRRKVEKLERAMRGEPQLDIPVKHYFAHGTYAREVTLPKGTLATGKIHKYSQVNIISKGEVSVVTESGVIRIKAPYTLVSPPGTKRAVYTHKETVWTTIHSTYETDVEKIEEHFIAKSDADYLLFCETLKIKDESCPG